MQSLIVGGLLALVLPCWCRTISGAPQTLEDQDLQSAPGARAHYTLVADGPSSGVPVRAYSLTWGVRERRGDSAGQWLCLEATKSDSTNYRVWLLTQGYPAETLPVAQQQILRFIVQQGSSPPWEFRDRLTSAAVLPSLGGWIHLLPRGRANGETSQGLGFPKETRYLGHLFRLSRSEKSAPDTGPPSPRIFRLQPDRLVGVPSNTRQRDSSRRYDGSEYEYVRLQRAEYLEMAEGGINCVRVDKDQLPFVDDLDVFFWGVGVAELSFPECLYNSRYLGPALFLDEPAVSTRDHVLRPRLAKDDGFRSAITPELAFDAFRQYFAHAWEEGAATSFSRSLKAGGQFDLGDMQILQENLYSWETMVSTAAYQLSQDERIPNALVFEPPGRVGTRRTLPEIDMTYGCQIPPDNPNYFIDIIYGFLRGAARLTGKQWGTSIYGAVDRADAFWFLTRAYDLGATRFFFWDNAQLACVPYSECLALARALKQHADNYPLRDLPRLKQSAEVVILLPAGYNLGHVSLGKGNLWGLPELNLERRNSRGVPYRTVMSNFFAEIERYQRLGVAFDLLGEFPGIEPTAYRELVRIREDGKIEIREGEKSVVLDHARSCERPPGAPPALAVSVSNLEGTTPLSVAARAVVRETSAPVFYTLGTDPEGIYRNAVVAWELYGPGEADHRFLTFPGLGPHVTHTGRIWEALVEFKLERPGAYRLRAATVDTAGRSTVVWTPLRVSPK